MASSSSTQKILKRANPNTIHDKFLVGYQGWFTCPGDGEPVGPGHHGWLHWCDKPLPDGGRPNLDLWPDVSSYSPSELYPFPGVTMKSGEPPMLFSSRNAQTVQRHFHWMAEHGVDGAFLQRFAGQCDLEAGNEGIRRIRDEVGDRVREAAEREGRVWSIMYDVTGVPADRIQRVLEQDWLHLLITKRILDSPNYLKEKGKPVVALWGFGFDNAGHTPALVRSIAQFFRNTTPGGVYLMGGTPTHWRTCEGDADRHPEFLDVWLTEFDAISPWTIGRYKTEDEADDFAETKMKGDIELIKRRNEEGAGRSGKIDYIPVVFPGSSGYNLSQGNWAFNDAPRKGGRFLWKQVFNARRAGARIIYGAMWDEYDEGTAFLPAVTNKRSLPISEKWNFLALDAEGHDLPSDWYMRICGFAAEALRGERRMFDSFPSKELQDYWGTRPKYEQVSTKSADFISGHNNSSSSGAGTTSGSGGQGGGSSSSAGDGQSYEEWLANQRTEVDEAPPPPYTLEVEELESAPAPTAAPAQAASSSFAAPAATLSTTIASTPLPPGPSEPGPHQPLVNNAPPPLNHQTRPHNYDPQPSVTHPTGTAPNPSMAALTNDFNRIGIAPSNTGNAYQSPSGPQPPVSSSSAYEPGRIPGSPPPLHPAHPASYGRPTGRPQFQSSIPTGFQSSRPTSHGPRPPSAQATQTVAAAASAPTPPVPAVASPGASTGTGQWSQGQWPPPEWGVAPSSQQAASSTPQYASPTPSGGASLTQPQTFSANSYAVSPQVPASSASSNVAQSQYGQSGGGAGGANLTRPQTFTANSYGGPMNTSPRPSGALQRPSSAAAGGGVNSTYGGGPPPSAAYGSANAATSGYNMPSGYSSSGYSMPSSYAPPSTGPSFPGSQLPQKQHSGGSGSVHFPSSSSAYPPYSSNTGGGSSFPNAAPSTPYQQPTPNDGGGYGMSSYHHNAISSQWSSGPSTTSPHGSPPISPSGMNSFSTNHPSSSGSSTPYPDPASYHSHSGYGGGPQQQAQSSPYGGFPHAAGGEMNYFGNAGSNMGMPQGNVHAHGSSSVGYSDPQQAHGGMPSSYQMPGNGSGSGSSYYTSAQSDSSGMGLGAPSMPWVPGGGPGGPSLPPRPSNYMGTSSYSSTSAVSKPPQTPGGSMLGFGSASTSGAGASALGLALSAVDKVAGRKTRDQLESGVGSLAQTGSKLFSKFTK